MKRKKWLSGVSVSALLVAGLVAAGTKPAQAQPVSASHLQAELNSLQAQIDALKSQQAELSTEQAEVQAQAKRQAIIAAREETITTKLSSEQLGTDTNRWYANNGPKVIPEFVLNNGTATFTIGGQIEVDAGLGSVPAQRGFSGGTNFRRIEFYIEGVYDQHWLYKVENDWTKTSTPLGGLLDVYFGYQNKLGNFHNIVLVGNQHTPFGFQTASDATLFLENDMGQTLFQNNRQLGITNTDYNQHFNFWYGVTGTNNGTQSSAATSTTTIDTGATTFKSDYTASADLAWNIISTPGHLLSIRNSVAYNRYNAALSTANDVTYSSGPDLNIYGAKFISTPALPLQAALVDSPRIDFEDNRLTLAAAYYTTSTYTNAIVSKTNRIAEEPHFSAWDLEAEYFLTDDHEPYSNRAGYYESVIVKHPVTKGGLGAIQLAARVDEADLNDAKYGIHGGNETNLTLGVNWWPTSYTRVNLNYVRMFPIGGGKLVTNYHKSASILGLRLEFIY